MPPTPPFTFARGAELYAAARHPRLLFGPGDLPALRDQVSHGIGRKIFDAWRPPIERLADDVLATDDLGAFLRARDHRPTEVRVTAFLTALAGELTGSSDCIEAAKRILIASADEGRIDPKGYDLLAPRLTPSEQRRTARAMVSDLRQRIEKRRMSYYANAAHNLTLGYALGGLWSLLAIKGDPGVPSLDREERELLRRYEATLYTILSPDGYPEEDIGYGTAVFGMQLLLGEALRRAGLFDPYVAYEGVAAFGQAMLHFVQPWGEALANTGDHGSTFSNREFSLPRVAAETNDPTLLWLAGTLDDAYRCFTPDDDRDDAASTVRARNGAIFQVSPLALLTLGDLRPARHPAKAKVPTQYRDRRRGLVTFRSGWDADATFVVFDGAHRSPAAPGHWHDSAGHFSISALGELFGIDTGRYNNEQNQHNVVLIDGRSGRSTQGEWVGSYYHGQLLDYVPDALCDVAAADSSHQSNACWARRWLGLVKGGPINYAWTVEDVNADNDRHEFWWQLQTCPGNTIRTRKRGATIEGHRHGNCLDVDILLPPGNEFPDPHMVVFAQDINSTSSHKYIPDPQARAAAYARPERMAYGPCFVRPRLLAKVSGYNGRFLSVMTPRRKGAQRATVRQLAAVPSSFAAVIDIGHYRDTLLFAYEHDLLEADGIVARGRWAVVRRAPSGRVVAWTLGHGRSLSVDGRKLC